MADDIKNVFISHVHEDDDGLAALKELIGKGGLTVRDSSINSSNPNDAKDPDYIKSKILAPQIQWASTLLVYITPDTKDSEWVKWEIEYAEKVGKRIVGIYAQGANDCDVPEALEKYADDVRGWQSDGIVDAILGKTNEWHEPSARDYGFAPNPFFGVCTLATCKPKIRSAAAIGDWVMGTGSKPTQREKNVGGFGGCTASLIEALKGGTPDVLTDAFQIREPLNKAVADRYRTVAEGGKTTAVDYAAEVRFLNGTGVGGLNNGVSADENEILFTSKNLPEIVHLLLKGLTAHSRSAGK